MRLGAGGCQCRSPRSRSPTCRNPALELPLWFWQRCCRARPRAECVLVAVPLGSRDLRQSACFHWEDCTALLLLLVTVTFKTRLSGRRISATPWIPAACSATRQCADRSRRLQRWPAGMAAASRTDGGDTMTADMDGSGRCSGRSPITTSTTTRSCGVYVVGAVRPRTSQDSAAARALRRCGRRNGRPSHRSDPAGSTAD
jgi:hypothetical protein